MNAETANLASQIGAMNKNIIVSGRQDKANDFMLHAIRAKISQWPNINNLLKGTGTRQLIYHDVDDWYWGDAGDGTGGNNLGKILMALRT